MFCFFLLINFVFLVSSYASIETLEKRPLTQRLIEYQKQQAGYPNSENAKSLSDLLKEARANPISIQEYNFLKGASAKGAAGAYCAHKKGLAGKGISVLLLEDAGINGREDIRKIVDKDSFSDSIANYRYKQDHGASMASLIHQMAPEATIYLRPINGLEEFLNANHSDFLIVNASFKSKGEFDQIFSTLQSKKKQIKNLIFCS